MKKFITFNNFIALTALVMFFLGFCPCFVFANTTIVGASQSLNLFQATFGVTFALGASHPITLIVCGGLVVAFIFMILGILLNVSKNKIRIGSLLAAPCYLTAGILLCLSTKLIYYTNINVGLGTAFNDYYPTGVKFAISIMFIVLGCFNIIDAIATFAKPKQVEVY